jgi:chromosome transmission fidelity protein 4
VACVRFQPNGTKVAIASEENRIVIVDSEDISSVKILDEHKAGVKSIAFDPRGEFLVSCSCDGTSLLWNLNEGKSVHRIHHSDRTPFGLDAHLMSASWNSSGEQLAMPGFTEVRILSRDTWKTATSLKHPQGHASIVTACVWSSDDAFVATTDMDGKILVWHVESGQLVAMHKLDAACMSLTWCASSNAIVACDEAGHLVRWGDVVPSSFVWSKPSSDTATAAASAVASTSNTPPSPTTTPTTSGTNDSSSTMERKVPKKVKRNPFIDMEADDEDDEDEEIGRSRRKSRAISTGNDDDEDVEDDTKGEIDDDGGLDDDTIREHVRKRAKKWDSFFDKHEEIARNEQELDADEADEIADDMAALSRSHLGMPMPVLQPPMQPGQTAVDETYGINRRFLAWNRYGAVVVQDYESHQKIEIEFNNKSKHHNTSLTDHQSLSMAAFDEQGVILASAASGADADKSIANLSDAGQPSVLRYHAFDSWTSNRWQCPLPQGESAQCVALGSDWIAVATSRDILRVFALSGLQKAVLCLPGLIVSLVGQNDTLCMVFHHGVSLPGHQSLSMRCLDMRDYRCQVQLETPLVLSARAKLAWIGFGSPDSDSTAPTSDVVFTFDSTGQLRSFVSSMNQWAPMLNAYDSPQFAGDVNTLQRGEVCWPVYVQDHELLYVKCRRVQPYPSPTTPLPIIHSLPLHLPLISTSATTRAEEQLVRHGMFIDEYKQRDDGYVEPSTLARLDRVVLPMIMDACQQGKSARAEDLAKSLRLIKSLKAAVQIANKKLQPTLAERINAIIEERTELALDLKFGKQQEQPLQSHHSFATMKMQPAQAPEPTSSSPPPTSFRGNAVADASMEDADSDSESVSRSKVQTESEAPAAAIFRKKTPTPSSRAHSANKSKSKKSFDKRTANPFASRSGTKRKLRPF